jgi:hypothetical protein
LHTIAPVGNRIQFATESLSRHQLRNTFLEVLTITGFLDFAYRPEFQILENTMFRKLDLFPPSDEGRDTTTLLGPLERANLNHWTTGSNRAGVSFPSPEDGNTSSFPEVVFSSYLEFRTMDKVNKPSNSECYA